MNFPLHQWSEARKTNEGEEEPILILVGNSAQKNDEYDRYMWVDN
jgi:hypothetical protein